MLQFVCADNTVVTIRPSGTEPKIKYYYGVRTEIPSEDQYEVKCRDLDEKLNALNDLFQK